MSRKKVFVQNRFQKHFHKQITDVRSPNFKLALYTGAESFQVPTKKAPLWQWGHFQKHQQK